jgi:flavodoxin
MYKEERIDMKAIVYASIHHGNTKKVVEAIAKECEVELIDATQIKEADLSKYDAVGFASGIYYSKFHQAVLNFAAVNLYENAKVFFISTYGGNGSFKSIEAIAKRKNAVEIGRFSCKGYDTFGPFKLVGGLAKGHPDETDLDNAVAFIKGLESEEK